MPFSRGLAGPVVHPELLFFRGSLGFAIVEFAFCGLGYAPIPWDTRSGRELELAGKVQNAFLSFGSLSSSQRGPALLSRCAAPLEQKEDAG